jgi:hypothetical protein
MDWWIIGSTDKLIDGRMDGWMDGWMVKWIGGQIKDRSSNGWANEIGGQMEA